MKEKFNVSFSQESLARHLILLIVYQRHDGVSLRLRTCEHKGACLLLLLYVRLVFIRKCLSGTGVSYVGVSRDGTPVVRGRGTRCVWGSRYRV